MLVEWQSSANRRGMIAPVDVARRKRRKRQPGINGSRYHFLEMYTPDPEVVTIQRFSRVTIPQIARR